MERIRVMSFVLRDPFGLKSHRRHTRSHSPPGLRSSRCCTNASSFSLQTTLTNVLSKPIHVYHHHHRRLKSSVSVLSTGRTVPPIECFNSYECCNSIGVLERFVFTGRMPFLMPNQAHQVCKAKQLKHGQFQDFTTRIGNLVNVIHTQYSSSQKNI